MVLVDTSIWSLALRRDAKNLNPSEQLFVKEWAHLVKTGEASLIGIIRQEILSGIRSQKTFDAIQNELSHFPVIEILPEDYDMAAVFFNTCRAYGITGETIDFLICAVASRSRIPIFTTDPDFTHYVAHIPVTLHRVKEK